MAARVLGGLALDEDTPLLADVKNPLLYAWYRMTDGPDNVEDAYRGEAAVLHTLYPFGAVMLTACFVKMSLIEDGGLLTTIANRWATTMAARTYDTVTNVQAQAAAADKVVDRLLGRLAGDLADRLDLADAP